MIYIETINTVSTSNKVGTAYMDPGGRGGSYRGRAYAAEPYEAERTGKAE
jgi:hypothetical protein